MDTFAQNVRYALRSLLSRPAFTAAALIALTLGIGANVAIFSVVHGVLLRPLPFPEPDRVVALWESQPAVTGASLSAPDFKDWREQSTSFEALAAWWRTAVNLQLPGGPERVDAALVSADFFRALKVRAQVGRLIGPEDDGARAVVLSDRFWREKLSADPAVVGRTVTVEGEPWEIAGVLTPGVEWPSNAQLWLSSPHGLPVLRGDTAVLEQRGSHYLVGLGRLAPGASLDQARRELEGIAARIADGFPSNRGHVPQLEEAHARMVQRVRPTLWVLLGAVGLVLLIACANVANLLLARATTRRRELAIRTALGATRRQLVTQLLTESLVLSLLGGVFGVLLAYWGVDALVAVSRDTLPRAQGIAVNGAVVVFAAVISVLTGLSFGLAPALLSSEGTEAEVLRAGGQGTIGGLKTRLRGFLVGAEMAVALVLLVGAGLLLRSFVNLLEVTPGFNPDGVLTFRLTAPRGQDAAQFYAEVEQRLAALPGVSGVGATTSLPLGGSNMNGDFYVDGQRRPDGASRPVAEMQMVSPGYFQAMEIPLLAGRAFDGRDRDGAQPVVIVNQAMARVHFGGDALGKRVSVDPDGGVWMEIVGVVGDVRQQDLSQATLPELFFPLAQHPMPGLFFTVRSGGEPLALLPTLRAEVSRLTSLEPLFNARTMDDVLSDSFATRRLSLLLIIGFAVVALVLSVVGIYGVVSYSVAQRTREIGIRIALGAARTEVVRMVVRQSLTPAALGLLAGVLGAVAFARILEGLTYGVSPLDPLTFTAVAACLATAALAAAVIPARKASRVDPQIALRQE